MHNCLANFACTITKIASVDQVTVWKRLPQLTICRQLSHLSMQIGRSVFPEFSASPSRTGAVTFSRRGCKAGVSNSPWALGVDADDRGSSQAGSIRPAAIAVGPHLGNSTWPLVAGSWPCPSGSRDPESLPSLWDRRFKGTRVGSGQGAFV